MALNERGIELGQTETRATTARGIMQRTCGCGQHTIAGGQCADCCKNHLNSPAVNSSQRDASNTWGAESNLLSSNGHPTNEASGVFSKSSFVKEFSRVPIQSTSPTMIPRTLRSNVPSEQAEPGATSVGGDLTSVTERPAGGLSKIASMIQRKLIDAGKVRLNVPVIILETIKNKLGQGQPLETSVRLEMEALLGASLNQVTIHTDTESQKIARALQARAFSVWQDVFFTEGAYDPHSIEGQRLLAHELAHVLRRAERGVSSSNLSLEVVTDHVEEAVAESAEQRVEEAGKLEEAGPAKELALEAGESPGTSFETTAVESDLQQGASQISATSAVVDSATPSPSSVPDLTLEPLPKTESTSESEASTAEEPKAEGMAGATIEKTPTNPQEDSAYQGVIKQLNRKARQQKTPPVDRSQAGKAGSIKFITKETSKNKTEETVAAARLSPGESIEAENKKAHLEEMEKNLPESRFTVPGLMEAYDDATANLAEELPKDKAESSRLLGKANFEQAKTKAKEKVVQKRQSDEKSMRAAAEKDISASPVDKASPPIDLEVTDPGRVPAIKNAGAAAPKPRTDPEISLDDKSRELDEALANNSVNGQAIDIKEESLALPVSGEPSFDDAATAKREAQDEIQKAKPRYREEESKTISESQSDMLSNVGGGLAGLHGLRSDSFRYVVDKGQQLHKPKIEGENTRFLGTIRQIYKVTKTNFENELKKLENIEDDYAKIIEDAEKTFRERTHTDLEYVYTPGAFDYSDWIDEDRVQTAINQEIKDLKAKKKSNLEEQIRQLPEDNKIRGWLAKSYVSLTAGSSDWVLYQKAVRNVQDQDARRRFQDEKELFIATVKKRVETDIAERVVNALNAAKGHIQDGKEASKNELEKIHDPAVREKAANALTAIMSQYENLESVVDDRQQEIIGDMARTFKRSTGKLEATFEKMREEVLTSWFEKAWKKIKAVVKAIIEFAARIAELLGRLAYLVDDIITSPRYFFNNLVNGIGQGFSTFVERIDEFLAKAFFDWLRGASGSLVQLPADWSPGSIFSLFTQLLDLSTETVWERMEIVYDKPIADAFRRGEVLLERGLEIFRIVRTQGLGGLWNYVKESLGNILQETLDMIKETILYSAIRKVITEIGKLIVPGGGFIAIAEKVIRLLQFIVEARNKILDLIKSFVDSVEMAVNGDIPGIVNRITTALTTFITIAIDFLVSFFGLRSLKEKVERFIERMRKPVIRGIDWMLNKFKPVVYRVAGLFGKERAEEQGQDGDLDEATKKEAAEGITDEPEPAETMRDFPAARRAVRAALDSSLPNGSQQVEDISKVLDSVASRVRPALTNLRVEEVTPGQPKKEGAIGFKVRARTQAGKNPLIAAVRFSEKGKVLTHEERWEMGVKGVKRAILQLKKRQISEKTIKAQFPRWQSEFGFTLLALDTKETPWWIEGAMSKLRKVTPVGDDGESTEMRIENGELIIDDNTRFEIDSEISVKRGGGWQRGPNLITKFFTRTFDGVEWIMLSYENKTKPADSGTVSAKSYAKQWRKPIEMLQGLSDAELERQRDEVKWNDFVTAKKVLNYRAHGKQQVNPPGKDWEHIVEQGSLAIHSADNLALADSTLNNELAAYYKTKRVYSELALEDITEPISLRDYLLDKDATVQRYWKLKIYREEFQVSLQRKETDHGPYQILK